MGRLMLVLAALAIAMLVATPAALTQSRDPDGANDIYISFNCEDFDTQPQAQEFYDIVQGGVPGGDPDGLDNDKDGKACESLPGRGAVEGGTTTRGSDSQPSKNELLIEVLNKKGELLCTVFPLGDPEVTQRKAQDFFGQNPSDPNGLDADGDGVACEYTLTRGGGVEFEDGSAYIGQASSGQYETPSGDDVASDQTSGSIYQPAEPDAERLSDTGGADVAALLPSVAGLLLAAGLLISRMVLDHP